jgi:uncharacterized protein (DUF2147 family)
MEYPRLNIARMPSDCPITGLDTASARARETLGIARAFRRARSVADSLPALVCAALLALSQLLGQTASAATPIPVGRWIWDTGEAAIEFHPCGTALCGRVVWLRDETEHGSEHVVDSKNPDSSLRSRRICGLDYITGLRLNPDGAWVAGRIYDVLHGHTYDLDLTNVKPDRIEMRGYQGIHLLGTTLDLLPAPAELPNCLTSQSDPSQEGAK